jgi:biuret amidohydrolase
MQTYEVGRWRDVAAGIPSPVVAMDADRTALILVDLQRKSCDRSAARGLGAWMRTWDAGAAEAYFERLETVVVPNVRQLLAFFRERSMPVVHFVVGPLRPDGRDMPPAFRTVYEESSGAVDETTVIHAGSPEFEIIPDAAPLAGEPVFHKRGYGGFTGTGAETTLRNLGIDTLVLVGGTAHVCVESTGRAAADLGFSVVAVEDAVIDYEPLMYDAAMITFSTIVGKVLTTAEVLHELAQSS